MAWQYTRMEVIQRLRKEILRRRPIVVAGAGIGLTAKCAELGGADLIVIYNSGLFRMHGHGSSAGTMPFGDANQIVLDMGLRSILPVVQNTPVIAGVCGTDVTRVMRVFLKEIKEAGFSGVINFPTVGSIDGNFRERLEDIGLGFEKEVELMRMARSMDLFTMAYVFNPQQAKSMAKARVDALVAHMGLTTGGAIGSKHAKQLQAVVPLVQEILDVGKRIKRDIIRLAHGGSISSPEDTEYIYRQTNAQGFVGASSIERIPVEIAIRKVTEDFKSKSIPKKR
ncbi:MAG: phosphoenolpyruvate hydrolase family protein [Thermodesulfobacteriota bacterium]|nr:phosphoenolpyruvate hydrolase family protein [Thermodesulfobacteriota bacterium]